MTLPPTMTQDAHLADTARRFREAQEALEEARLELEHAIASAGFRELFRHIVQDTGTVTYGRPRPDGSGDEIRRFDELARL